MFRYVAFLTDPKDSAQQRALETFVSRLQARPVPWRQIVNADGLRILSSGARSGCLEASVFAEGQWIVLGCLYRSNGDPADPSPAEQLAVIKSKGRVLIDQYWGSYISFIRADAQRSTMVLRDPSGAIHCFDTTACGVRILCSHADDLFALGLRFDIDWEYVATELPAASMTRWNRTGLRGVTASLPGECVEISNGSFARTRMWDPLEVCRHAIEDAAYAAVELRRLVRLCVQARSTGHDRLVLLLSGGLDSSIILSCMGERPFREKVSCLTFHHPTMYGDERRFARLAAERAKCQLTECKRPPDVDLSFLLRLPKTAFPLRNALDYGLYGSIARDFAKTIGATAIFTGHMGDQLFCRSLWRYAVSDEVWRSGVNRSIPSTALDVARVEGDLFWSSLACGVVTALLELSRRKFKRAQATSLTVRNQFVNERHIYDALRRAPKWYESAPTLPPGCRLHVMHLCSYPSYSAAIGDWEDAEEIQALYAQPVIEHALRLPLRILVNGGWDRSIARRAFARDVPQQIVFRRCKGTYGGHRTEIFGKNRKFFRELLLDGLMIREGLLNNCQLEATLSNPSSDLNDLDLLRCLTFETWLQNVKSEMRVAGVN